MKRTLFILLVAAVAATTVTACASGGAMMHNRCASNQVDNHLSHQQNR